MSALDLVPLTSLYDQYSSTPSDRGFSAVEVMISIIIAAMFTTAFFSLFGTITQFSTVVQQRSHAGAYAYSYLSKASADAAQSRASIPCDSTTDLVTNPAASGKTLQTDTGGNQQYPLPSPVAVTTMAYYPMGCASPTPVLKLVVTLTWGPYNAHVQQGTYVN